MKPQMIHTLALEHDTPPPRRAPVLRYEPAAAQGDGVWHMLRIVLIAWASLGIARTLPDVSRHLYGPRQIETFIHVAGLAFTLSGAIASRTAWSRNASQTIGAGLLTLHVAFAMFVGGGSVRSPAGFLLAVQQLLLPLLPLIVRRDAPEPGGSDGAVLGHPFALLLAAQIPAAIGMIWVGAILVEVMDAGLWGLHLLAALASSVAGSLLSLVLSLCFGRTAYGEAGEKAAVLHAMYLAALILCVVIGIAGHPVRPGP